MSARAVISQADLMRLVKTTVLAHVKAGLIVTGTKTTFHNGEPIIEVTTAPDSVQPANAGGVNVESFQKALRKRHAARRA